MQVHDDILHFGIINCSLGGAPPCLLGTRIVREHADYIQIFEVSKFQCLWVFNAATKNQMQFRIVQKTSLNSFPWPLRLRLDQQPLTQEQPC